MERYAVLLVNETQLPGSLAIPLAETLGRTPAEVGRSLREQPWIPVRGVPAISLDAVFDLLVREGVKARAVPEVHMPELPPPCRVRIADPLPRSFLLQSAGSPAPPTLDWSTLEMASVGLVTIRPDEARSHFGKGAKRNPEPEERPLLDIVTGGEQPLRLRIDGKEFVYDCLGDRMQHSSRANLKELLRDIKWRAPHTRFTPRTVAFLAGEPVVAWRFRSLASFDAHSLWTLVRVREELAEEREEMEAEAAAAEAEER